MENILVFGHKNPDTDSICSALVKAILDKKKNGYNNTAARLGELNKETQFVLNYLGIEPPMLLDSVKEGQEVILVDHNEFCQSVSGIENAKIIGVIDHHRIADFQTADPLYYTARPYGCTCTILYEMFKEANVTIEKTEAILMLSAIISDTLLLKSPTTTPKDIEAVKELANIAQINYETYGLEMLKAGTDLSDYSPAELLKLDAKSFEMKGNQVKIAQVNTIDIEEVFKKQADFEKEMQNTIAHENLDLFVFAVTDIMNSNSEVLVLGKRSDIVEKAYGVTLENNRAFLPGVVSRKKQMLPIMTENA